MTFTLVLKKGFHPKGYVCEILKLYHLPDSKAIVNVKVFEGKKMDRWMDGPKAICPHLSIYGHNKQIPSSEPHFDCCPQMH